MQDIIFVSHCVLNIASKVVMYNEAEMAAEEDLRRRFVHNRFTISKEMRFYYDI